MDRFIHTHHLYSNKQELQQKADDLGLSIDKLSEGIEYDWHTILIDLQDISTVKVVLDTDDTPLAAVELKNGSYYILNTLFDDLIGLLDANVGNVVKIEMSDEPAK